VTARPHVARDPALRRLTRLNRSIAAIAVVATGVLTEVAANAFPGALGATFAFVAGVVIWVPSGPLGRAWARRSGTPPSLLVGPTPAARAG
jgi:hypothetical protein